MIDVLKTLAQMQRLDDEIGRFRILQQELPKQLNELIDNVEKAQVLVLQTETSRSEVVKKQKNVELEIKQYQETSRKYATQLSEIKTNKEYKALNSEIANFKQKISDLESVVLELMEQESEWREKLLAAQKELDEAEKSKREKEGELRKLIQELDGKIEETRNKRNDLARTLPTPLIKQYANLIKYKNNQAVAFNLNGSCGGCGFIIRPQMIIELDMKRKIVNCESCGRILLNRITDEHVTDSEEVIEEA